MGYLKILKSKEAFPKTEVLGKPLLFVTIRLKPLMGEAGRGFP
jgi:hypothetical protein